MKFWAADVSVFCVNIYWEREQVFKKCVRNVAALFRMISCNAMYTIELQQCDDLASQWYRNAKWNGMQYWSVCVLLYSGSSRLSLWQRTAFRGQVVAAPDMSFNLFSFSVKTTWVLNTFTDENIHSARWSSFSNNWKFMKIFWPNFSNPKL